jgi:CheY-like chemotaxis protein
MPSLSELDFTPENLAVIRSHVSSGSGLLVVAGPPHSGRTTTLDAVVREMATNPTGTGSQSAPVHRCDADAIADLLNTGTTGSFVVTELDATDTFAAIRSLVSRTVRLDSIPSRTLVVAQRLVRRACTSCAMIQSPREEVLEAVGVPPGLASDGRWVVGFGCAECNQSGYRGLLPLHEVLLLTSEIVGQISRGAPEGPHPGRASTGRRTLLDDGVQKAARSLTTLEEIVRVLGAGEPASERARPAAEPPTGTRRVLIVEDDPTTITVVRYFLGMDGFEVLTAADGKAGLDLARAHCPDVIISDLSMPGMTGRDLIRTLRSDARTAGIRILILTADASPDGQTSVLAAGADDYLVKPVDPGLLARRIKALLASTR